MKAIKLLLIAILVLSSWSSAKGENNQTLVLGGGIGIHFFSEHDDTREGDTLSFMDDVNTAGSYRFFTEWYVLGNFGIGLLTDYQIAYRDYSTEGISVTHSWTIRHYFGTINIIPFGGETYARMGILIGGGAAVYSLNEDVWGVTNDYEKTVTVQGTATTFGIYGDWGGDLFGMRAGCQYINSNYPDLEIYDRSYDISSSGTTMFFDFRWAF